MQTEPILRLIACNPQGLTTDQILARLPGSVANGRSDVDEVLAKLQGERKVVRKPGRGWVARGRSRLPVSRSSPKPKPKVPKSKSGEVSQMVDGRMAAVRAVVERSTVATQTLAAGGDVESSDAGWALFRRLLGYYRACLQAEEHPDITVDMESMSANCTLLSPDDQWWPTVDKAVTIRLPVDHLAADFQASLSKGGGELFLGYPLQVVTSSLGGAFVRPIASFPATWRIEEKYLEVRAEPQIAEINVQWLQFQRKRRNATRQLEDWLGLGSAEDSDDPGATAGLEFESLIDRLAMWFAAEVVGTLNPALPAGGFDLTAQTGIYGALGLFVGSRSRYAQGTIDELDELARWTEGQLETTALGALFRPGSLADRHTEPELAVLEPLLLGEHQLAAARASLHQPLTVITGPPGTGKSQVVAAIISSAALQGRSALVASRNHKALDAVEERLHEITGDRVLIARLSRPWGESQVFDFAKALDALLTRTTPIDARVKLDAVVSRLVALDAKRWRQTKDLQAALELGLELGECQQAIEQLTNDVGDAAARWAEVNPALLEQTIADRADWREPLLWLFGLLPGMCRRAAKTADRMAVHRFIDALDGGFTALGWPELTSATLSSTRQNIERLKKLSATLKRRDVLEARHAQEVDQSALLEEIIETCDRLREQSADTLMQLPDALGALDEEERQELADLKGASKLFSQMGQSGRQLFDEAWRCHRNRLLGHFPLWAVTNLSIRGRLPFDPALFDYVVIDEAAQCDIASALPLLARARHAIIVGDPAQLTHVSRLSPTKEAELLRKAGIFSMAVGRYVFRANSLFDLANNSPVAERHLLRDHYRCHPEIADFINDAFYGRQLHPMTRLDGLNPPSGVKPGLHWTDVQGEIRPARSGCHCPAELEAVVAAVKALETQNYRGTIGVVSPFREQAQRLSDAIEKAVDPAFLVRTNLRAFTAHRFQGDARDVILFSLTAGPDMPTGSRRYLSETGNLFNVAVSRAKAVCRIFGDRDYARKSGIIHLSRLAEAVERRAFKPGPRDPVQALFESPWEERFYRALKSHGLEPIPQYPVAGRRLDLALIATDHRLDIEVDGDRYHRGPDGRRLAEDLWRDHQLQSLGWQVLRFWVYELRENMDECVQRVATAAK